MTNQAIFTKGDIVQLKSGGPEMTIKDVIEERGGKVSSYRCQWFAGKKLEAGVFSIESVKAASVES